MKRIFVMLLSVVLAIALSLPCFASTARVVDAAGLLSDGEISALTDRADTLSEEYDMDAVILFVSSLNGKDAQAYADDFYDENGYRPDGILFLFAPSDGYYDYSTVGRVYQITTEAWLDEYDARILPYLRQGRYADACSAFLDVTENLLDEAKSGVSSGEPWNSAPSPSVYVQRGLICLAVGFVVALIVVTVMKSKLKTVHFQKGAANYTRAGSFHLTGSKDLFLYSHVMRTERPRDNGSSRSGGGGGGHISSSGTTHGGRSGRI